MSECLECGRSCKWTYCSRQCRLVAEAAIQRGQLLERVEQATWEYLFKRAGVIQDEPDDVEEQLTICN